MKKIGILGSGNVAQSLGKGFINHGYDVKMGTRNPSKLEEWNSGTGNKASIASYKEAARFGDIIVLAIKGTAAKDVLHSAGAEHLVNKIIIDTTNPIADEPPDNGVIKYFTSHNKSLMEALQGAFPDAHFVKSFSCIGAHLMVNADFNESPSMFICGNYKHAKEEVGKILKLFGFEVEDMGGAEAARAIEPLAMLWCIPGFKNNQWGHAFRLLKL